MATSHLRPILLLALASATVIVGGCAAPLAPRSPAGHEAAARLYEGRVLYELREPTARGASSRIQRRPARFVAVRALGADGEPLAESMTDDAGRFRFEGPAGAARLRVEAMIDWDEYDLSVGADPSEGAPHAIEGPAPDDGESARMVALEVGAEGAGGAFHILDTLLEGALAVRRWVGATLPPLHVHWRRGGTTEWSFYRGEQPAGSGRYLIELLGGEPGRQHLTDTDEHDEEIILHELGHFVMDVLTTDSSAGGMHPGGHLVEPGLAWEEGRASWFATAVQGDPRYRDTVGVEPSGELRVDDDHESMPEGPRGLGSEAGVSEILWDLTDGVPGYPDRDDDGIALGPARILEAMMELSDLPGAFPAISTFLARLIETGSVPRERMARLLSKSGHPREILPPTGTTVWPLPLPLDDPVSGKIDSVSEPAPSGGPPRPRNGADAVRVYRVHVTDPGFLEIRLRIFGSGRAEDQADLDLELRTIRADPIASSLGRGPEEMIGRLVSPGYYIVYVRGGGGGNRVGYELVARLRR